MRIKVEKTNRHNKQGYLMAKITIGNRIRHFGIAGSLDNILYNFDLVASNEPFEGS